MKIEEICSRREQLYRIAAKYGIKKVSIFGSVARGDSTEIRDIDFLVELDENASVFGVGGFQYEVQKLFGVDIDVIPTFALPNVEDKAFVQRIKSEAVAL